MQRSTRQLKTELARTSDEPDAAHARARPPPVPSAGPSSIPQSLRGLTQIRLLDRFIFLGWWVPPGFFRPAITLHGRRSKPEPRT